MQTTFQDNAQDDSGCRRVDSSSDDCATPTKRDAKKTVAAASGCFFTSDFTATDKSRRWLGHINAKPDDGKTLATDEREEDKTSQGRDGRSWRYGSDRWDSLNTMTHTHREYDSWSSDDIWSAQTKTPDLCNKSTPGKAAAGQSSGKWWTDDVEAWHAEISEAKRSELNATDDQAPPVLEELPDTTGNATTGNGTTGNDTLPVLDTDVKAADAGAEVSREE